MRSSSMISSDSRPEASSSFMASAERPTTPLSIASARDKTALEAEEALLEFPEAAKPEPAT